jgi:two-component system NarL family sensor kinase
LGTAVRMDADTYSPQDEPAGGERGQQARRARAALRGELLAFLAVSLFALLAVAGATIALSGWIARDNQLDDAERVASRIAEKIVKPLLTEAEGGLAQNRAQLDGLLQGRVQDDSVTKFLVWSSRGEILYSTDQTEEGGRPGISDDLGAALSGTVVSQVDEHPELSGGHGPSIEVYVPMTVDGKSLVLETYFAVGSLDRAAALLRSRIVPLAVGALAVLELVQIPLVVSLTRRLSRQEAERTQLVISNLVASDRERREIAADVHDGPVQELAGVSYALSALRPTVPENHLVTVDRVITAVRSSVASLRRLMVQIYPPDLSGPGLATALEDLAGPLRERGLSVHVLEENKPGVSPSAASVLYRTAREALANVVKHSEADTVWIRLEEAHHDGLPAVRLTVADNGAGLVPADENGARDRHGLPTPTGDAAGEPGHLGLRLVRDRLVEAGGALTVSERAGGGVVLDAVVPVQHGD